MLDTKPHAFEIEGEGEWAPNEAIHQMSIRVTLDETMVIRDIAVCMDAHPHDPCPQAMPPMQGLIGETLGKGWRKTIERHLGGTVGCTHLRELLFNLATAAFQTRSASFSPSGDGRPPIHLGQCRAWAVRRPGGREGLPDVLPLATRDQTGSLNRHGDRDPLRQCRQRAHRFRHRDGAARRRARAGGADGAPPRQLGCAGRRACVPWRQAGCGRRRSPASRSGPA